MSAALMFALVFTVALVMTKAYFLMGSVPLLVLKHDTPLDARFVRGFFNTYYVLSLITAGGTAFGYALAGRPALATGAALLALLAFVLRRQVIPKMDALGAQIQSSGVAAIPGFRRTHLIAIGLNLAQLVLIVWCLMGLRTWSDFR
ncbi:MAG: hypothetical protein KA795_08560 [Burkholderiaceae bacterium]|nr:hypothetical protein [Burkholderiaceae bacterium]